jgi:hydroxymethylglutaryl-CoA reductase
MSPVAVLTLSRGSSVYEALCGVGQEVATGPRRTPISVGPHSDEQPESGGLDAATADKVVENVVGTYALPFGTALNVRVNDIDRVVPMVVEEPSVTAAASNAARMVRASGGFRAEMTESLMISQVQLFDVPDPASGLTRLREAADELLARATEATPGLLPYGEGPRAIEFRDLRGGMLVVHVLVDCRDAMGANMVNSIAEAIGPRVAQIGGGKLGLRILSNLCDRRRLVVEGHVHVRDLLGRSLEGKQAPHEAAEAIVQASRFAEADRYRAATHNKGIMNRVDAVVLATGNDWRAVEAGALAYAARSGRYAPLAVWRREGEHLLGRLDLPLALGTVGGTLHVHPRARLALRLLAVTTADELSMTAASVGLASNLAALRALATEGIQRGHMALHARSVATTAGAVGEQVERVASALAGSGTLNLQAAEQELQRLRGQG